MHRSPKEILILSAATAWFGLIALAYLFSTGLAIHWMDKWHGPLAGDLTLFTGGIPAYYVFVRMLFSEPRDPQFLIPFAAFHLLIFVPPLVSLALDPTARKKKAPTA